MSKSFYLSSYISVCLSSQFDHNLPIHGKPFKSYYFKLTSISFMLLIFLIANK